MTKAHKKKNKGILTAILLLIVVVVLLAILLTLQAVQEEQEEIKGESNKTETHEMTEQVVRPENTYHVVIETAHGIDENGNWDPGCSWNGIDEADLMLPITKAMVKYLRKNGVDVYSDADTDNDRNLFATLDYLDSHDVDAFVNVHCDYEEADSGTLSLYYTEEQRQLGEALNRGVHEAINIPDRGQQQRSDLDTLCSDKVHCASCLFETGCISKDYNVLKTGSDEYGKGLAKGLCDYLGVEFCDE